VDAAAKPVRVPVLSGKMGVGLHAGAERGQDMTYPNPVAPPSAVANEDGSGRIVVEGLSKQFRSVNAVSDLSFVVHPGTVTGFLGPNGSGKTTTLRMVLGLIAPTAGRATINAVPFAQLSSPGRTVGAVLDSQGFHAKRSARNHLRVYCAAVGVPDDRADQVLELVGLASAAGRKTGDFSLGMRQRLSLATALLGDPQVLVLDEPANGLDPEGIAWLRGFLQSFARTGRTVLVASHLLREVEQTVDSVVIVSRGVCVYQGTMDQLRSGQRTRVLVASADPAALGAALVAAGISDVSSTPDGRLAVIGVDAQRIGALALDAGVALWGMQEEQVDLEQVFFALTTGQFSGAPPPPGYPPPPPGYPPPPPGYPPPPPGYPPPPPGYPAPPPGYGPPPDQRRWGQQ